MHDFSLFFYREYLFGFPEQYCILRFPNWKQLDGPGEEDYYC